MFGRLREDLQVEWIYSQGAHWVKMNEYTPLGIAHHFLRKLRCREAYRT